MKKILTLLFVTIVCNSSLTGIALAAAPRASLYLEDEPTHFRGHYRFAPLATPLHKPLSIQIVPNDPYFSTSNSWGQSYDDQWGVKRIRADRAWDVYRGAGIRIAMVDSGVLWHEDISANIWENSRETMGRADFDDDGNGYVDDLRGWDFVANDPVPTDENGHGTHVGGIAAATGFNARGIAGVAPSAKVMRVRVLDSAGNGSVDSIASGIRYAARNGARIINMSLGGAISAAGRSILQNAVNYAHSLGSIMVAAIGNNAVNADNFSPANLDYVLGVGATDYQDKRASFSNYGSKLDFMAPGVDILSLGSTATRVGTPVSSNYFYASGTSTAAPFVSGAIALLLNKYPTANVFDIKKYLIAGAVDLGDPGWDSSYGFGRIDIARSLGLGGSSTSFSAASAKVLNQIDQRNQTIKMASTQRPTGSVKICSESKASELLR